MLKFNILRKTKMCETLISCEEHCVGTVGELQKQAPYCMKMGAYRSAPRRPKEVQAEGEEAPARLPFLTCAQGTAIAQTLSYSLADAHSVSTDIRTRWT